MLLRSPRAGARPACPRALEKLTLHGAGVEARAASAAYCRRPGRIVALTNRRPYGFDWRTGRLDAIEVLAEAKRRYD